MPTTNADRQEAVRRIHEVEGTGETWLDLGDLALEQLPPELAQLTHLRHLSLGTAHPVSKNEERIVWRHDPARPIQRLTELGPLVKLTGLRSLGLASFKSVSDLGPLRRLTELTSLDLSKCDLVSELGPLAGMTGLTLLDLSECVSLSDLRPLSRLTGLTTLYLFVCTSVSDLAPLQALTELATLQLYRCKLVSNVAPLSALTKLTTLNLSRCELVSDLAPLRALTALTSLDLSQCHLISELGPLKALTRLTSLNLSRCKAVSDLGPMRSLAELTELYLSGCSSVADLSPLLDLSKLQHLNLGGTAVPLPDHLRGSPDAAAIKAWYRENEQARGKRPLAEVKLLLVGQGRVGKTHLRLRLFDGEDIAHHDPTLASTKHIDYVESTRSLPVNHGSKLSEVKLRVWDFGGQDEMHSSHRFFLGAQRCFYLLVLAADRPANGESNDSNRLNYWLRVIAEYGRRDDGQKAPVLIVVTRSDLDRAKARREEIDEALEAARMHDWFGAKVVEVVRGLGWSRGLSKTADEAVWERHEAAARAIAAAIETHLTAVVDLDQPIAPVYHAAKAFVENAFSPQGIDGDGEIRTSIAGDDLKRFAALFDRSKAQKTDEQRDGLRRACLGLLNSLGVVHWVGDVPEIKRENRWNLRDIAFNPEWVRRPVYDLIRCGDADPENAGFLPDRQVRMVLAERESGDAAAADLYDRFPFRGDDRARILELMKACRLVFDMALDGRAEGGLLVPDLLKATPVSDRNPPVGAWTYTAEFLPEKMFLRFIARQYDSIDRRAGRCFRNQVVWRKGDVEAVLEAHYSPSGATLPFVLIRSAKSQPSVPESVAMIVQALLDEIYKEEQLGHVRRELLQVGKPSKLRANGPYVFRCEMVERTANRNRRARMVPRFTIVFNGVDLGSSWTCLVGLRHLHRLVRQPGKRIPAGEFFQVERNDAAAGYRFDKDSVEAKKAAENVPAPASKFAEHSTKRLKHLLKTAELQRQKAVDSSSERVHAKRVKELTDEIERRSNPALKSAMRSVQAELRKAVDELKARMKEKSIPEEHWGHFDHCTSSARHAYHFVYDKPKNIVWDTEDVDTD